MRVTRPKEIEAVLLLTGEERVRHFIKRVVDEERAWGLQQKAGFALVADDLGAISFPLWPAREYAELCVASGWAGFEATPLALVAVLHELLPHLREQNRTVAVFPSPSSRGVVLTPDALEAALREEMVKYGD
jgi:hypothetical protein